MSKVKLYWNLGNTYLRVDRLPIPELMPDPTRIKEVFTKGYKLSIPVIESKLAAIKLKISSKSNADKTGNLEISIGMNAKGAIQFYGVNEIFTNAFDRVAIFEYLRKKIGDAIPIKFVDLKSAVDTTETSTVILHKKHIRFKNPIMNLLAFICRLLNLKFRKRYFIAKIQVVFKYKANVYLPINECQIVNVKIISSDLHTYKTVEK